MKKRYQKEIRKPPTPKNPPSPILKNATISQLFQTTLTKKSPKPKNSLNNPTTHPKNESKNTQAKNSDSELNFIELYSVDHPSSPPPSPIPAAEKNPEEVSLTKPQK
jgi:hypothetical protein